MRPMPRAPFRSVLLLGLLTLFGCSLAPRVETDALSYHESADVTANRIILLNVLRAKDNAPLHFAELSLVHGSVSEAGGATLAQPVGEVPKSTSLPRASLSPTATIGDAVTFDLGTLDTQTFSQGVTAPISPKMLKYFLDSGVDHRLVLLLLLSSALLPGGNEAVANYPRSDRVVCYPLGKPGDGELPSRYEVHGMDVRPQACPGREREFIAFLRILNGLPRVFAVSQKPFVPVGPPFRPDNAHLLHDLLAMDHSKQSLRTLPGGLLQFTVQAPEDKIVLCEDKVADVSGSGAALPALAAKKTIKPEPDDPCNPEASSMMAGSTDGVRRQQLTDFTVRSTLGIFSFLGQVLGSQQRRSADAGTEICVTLDDRGPRPDCASGQVLFHLNHDPAHARFGVEYGGEYWGVPNVPPCLSSTDHCDHTLETLSMVSLLLNLSKSARDIPSTPAVQLVP